MSIKKVLVRGVSVYINNYVYIVVHLILNPIFIRKFITNNFDNLK